MNRLYLLALLTIIFPVIVCSQQQAITVKSFQFDENDLTATTNPVYDHNNQKCALIIVSNIGVGGYRFDAGNSFIKVEEKEIDGKPVYLLWVSDGTRRISIHNSDSDVLPLLNYTFQTPIKKAKTYFLELSEIFKSSRNSKQYLSFEITPVVEGLALEVDEIPWSLKNGQASDLVNAGEHTYRVSAPEYNTIAGMIKTQKGDGNKVMKIVLIPEFGSLTIDGGEKMNDAEIFVDGVSIGKGNKSNYKLGSGNHVIKIVKPHYKLYQSNVTVKDGESTSLKPQFMYNASDVRIITSEDANIYIDGELVGRGNWSGPLGIGQYIVESKLPFHKDVKQTIDITEINKKLNFKLREHEPILGSLSIESNPIGAKISIDGKEIGLTPYHINEMIIGSHKLVISKDGYSNYEQDIILYENKENKIVANLDNKVDICIESDPPLSALYINSEFVGTTPYSSNDYTKGAKLNIELRRHGYSTFQTSIVTQKSIKKKFTLSQLPSCTIDGTSGSYVYIDGKYVGRVPHTISGEVGEKHEVEIMKGNKKTSKTITLGKDTRFYGTLEEPHFSTCTIDGTAGGNVFINGKYVGRVPYTINGEVGEKYKVQIRWHGKRMKVRKKTITLGKDTRFYGVQQQHRNRGRQVANIAWTVCCPSLGWMSWFMNPVNE